MSSLLLVVFVVEATVQIIKAIGATAINDQLWNLINTLPVSSSQAAAEQRKLQAEYLKIRNEMNATSSQDEFARWAKLRRKHDKAFEKLEASKKGQDSARSSFDRYLTALRLVLTRGPQYLIPFWYATKPMFWLPQGWFPYYAEWIISFPRAPLGSVSIASWQLACTGLIGLVVELITGVLGLLRTTRKVREDPVPAAGTGEKSEEKKEL